jgi:hypothetical protein
VDQLEGAIQLLLAEVVQVQGIGEAPCDLRPEFRPRRPGGGAPPPPLRSSATEAATPGSGPHTWRAARRRPGDGTRGNRRRIRCHRTRARRHPRTGRTSAP